MQSTALTHNNYASYQRGNPTYIGAITEPEEERIYPAVLAAEGNIMVPRSPLDVGSTSPEHGSLSEPTAAQPSEDMYRPLDSVSWSQSRRWISQEAAARTAFNRMTQRLRHQGFDKSPFIPQNQAELVDLRISALSWNIKKYDADIRKREKQSKLKKNGVEPDSGPQLFGGRVFLDGLSAVLAVKTCFSGCFPQNEHPVAWPSLTELKASGRRLPPPHFVVARGQKTDDDIYEGRVNLSEL
jgi:hypothetical protein